MEAVVQAEATAQGLPWPEAKRMLQQARNPLAVGVEVQVLAYE